MAKVRPKKDIRDGELALQRVMTVELSKIAEKLVNDLMREYKKATPSQQVNAFKKVKVKGLNNYKSTLLKAVSELALDSLKKAQIGAPEGVKKLTLPTEFNQLPPDLQKYVKAQVELMASTQADDLEKKIYFQYGDSFGSIDSADIIQGDLEEAAEDFVTSASIRTGASAISSKVVNEARSAFFFQKDTLDQVEAFRFVNKSPVSPICKDLSNNGEGRVFAKNDPEMFRYTPPLHFNCKSYIEPIYSGDLGKEKIEKLKPTETELEKYIQFNE